MPEVLLNWHPLTWRVPGFRSTVLKTCFAFAACTDYYKHDPLGEILQVPRGIHNQYHECASRNGPHYETLRDHNLQGEQAGGSTTGELLLGWRASASRARVGMCGCS